MNRQALTRNKGIRAAIGVALSVACGLLLWHSSWGEWLADWSYDGLWVFGSRDVTNEVTFVMMDTESFDVLHQKRGDVWDRHLHAQLLNKLATDNCAAVVLDIFLGQRRDPKTDLETARAMRRHHEIALRAGYTAVPTDAQAMRPVMPMTAFLAAAGTNWGVSRCEPDPDGIVRKHWPFPSPAAVPSLAESALRCIGMPVTERRERWLRYYGEHPAWNRISYAQALKQPPNYFHEHFVFVGIYPKSLLPDSKAHRFKTPYSHWTSQCMSGTEMLMTEFLNLLNQESLRRSGRLEFWGLVIAGTLIGALLARLQFARALVGAVGVAIVVIGSAVVLTATTNYWFPWLLVVAGQLPVALVWSLVNVRANRRDAMERRNRVPATERPPEIPGYRLVEPAFGHGAYGAVWLARNHTGDWRAVKVVSLEKFGDDRGPYDREYDGATRYREISDKHAGLLRVDFVSEKFPTHFYYVMELGDAIDAGWEKAPGTYKPRDLNNVRSRAPQKRLPMEDCLRIGIALCDALDFLHRAGFTHRDIKPQNILFVNGQPKFADVGLITTIREIDSERTAVGTPGYMPPAPEMPGTQQADIYALGMVLYVISTGRSPTVFPELSETLIGGGHATEFFLLNSVILKACQPDPKERYGSVAEMRRELEALQAKVASARATPP